MTRWARLGGLVVLAACDGSLQLNLVVYDPCNQSVLEAAKVIQLTIEGHGEAKGTTWNAAEGEGELAEVPAIKDAIVSVVGRSAGPAGSLGRAIAAGSLGLVDLSGADGEDLVEVNIAIGSVNAFMNTTNLERPDECTGLGRGRYGHTASLLPHGSVLIVGGADRDVAAEKDVLLATSEIFEPRSGQFLGGPAGPARAFHQATVLGDGRVLVSGGVGGESEVALAVASLYDPEIEGFASTAISLQSARSHHSATLLADGRVLLAGGYNQGVPLATTEIVDAVAMTSQPGPSLRVARASHAAVRIAGDAVGIVGGRGLNDALGLVEFVVLGRAESLAGPTLVHKRSHVAAELMPGKDAIVVAGGFSGAVNDLWNGVVSDAIEVVRLNLANVSASEVTCSDKRLLLGRGAAASASIPGGFVLIGGFGGEPVGGRPGFDVLPGAETILVGDLNRCDLTQARTAGPLAQGRAAAQATRLPGGDILVTGGLQWSAGPTPAPSTAVGSEIFVRQR